MSAIDPDAVALSFEEAGDLTPSEVDVALAHHRHFLTHRLGVRAEIVLDHLDGRHDELHRLIEGAGWSPAVLVWVMGTFIDTNVECPGAPAPPMDRLAAAGHWSAAFSLHRQGDAVRTATAAFNCDLLRLACCYGGTVSLTETTRTGGPLRQVGVWRVDPASEPTFVEGSAG